MTLIRFLAYADDVHLIGDDIRTIERNADVLLNACEDSSLTVNIQNKYTKVNYGMFLFMRT